MMWIVHYCIGLGIGWLIWGRPLRKLRKGLVKMELVVTEIRAAIASRED